MARLKPGISNQQVEARLERAFESTVREEWNRALSSMSPARRSLPDVLRAGNVPRLQLVSGSKGAFDATPAQSGPLAILGVIVGIVLLIVCTNLANLLLSRAAARQSQSDLFSHPLGASGHNRDLIFNLHGEPAEAIACGVFYKFHPECDRLDYDL